MGGIWRFCGRVLGEMGMDGRVLFLFLFLLSVWECGGLWIIRCGVDDLILSGLLYGASNATREIEVSRKRSMYNE